MDEEFWEFLDVLVESSSIVIDRPRGTSHPRYSDLIYPLDYGHLADTLSSDQSEIDVWIGDNAEQDLEAIICTIDLLKKDVEVKVLLSCSEENIQKILDFHNSGNMRATVIRRN